MHKDAETTSRATQLATLHLTCASVTPISSPLRTHTLALFYSTSYAHSSVHNPCAHDGRVHARAAPSNKVINKPPALTAPLPPSVDLVLSHPSSADLRVTSMQSARRLSLRSTRPHLLSLLFSSPARSRIQHTFA
ncbi:hypothetical protein A0H81_14643 [Grifola frondosa]|uniref:Uncharacterized protein n=1 Tax=Grifola frondosa TaxID=5627 RepID=A0A1C7LL49_GRIFR|nr:hypothetical protein A0H81_14643 [Grifola frondosa]